MLHVPGYHLAIHDKRLILHIILKKKECKYT